MSDGPFEMEDFLASLVEVLKIDADNRAIVTVLEGSCWFRHLDQDWGIDSWQLRISLPVHMFHAMTAEEIEATEKSILGAAGILFGGCPSDHIESVSLSAMVGQVKEGWRDEAGCFVKGEGLTNQGRVRSDNIAAKQHQGLLFRSDAEIALFDAMVRARLAVAPLPVFIRVGNNYNRLEPDFLVVYKGLTFVVEVDGDTYHRELPADADRRLVPLTHEGVEVRRYRAEDLMTPAMADNVVKDCSSSWTTGRQRGKLLGTSVSGGAPVSELKLVREVSMRSSTESRHPSRRC